MKIDLNLVGTAAALPDYALLKEALLAAQAATPTARASRELRRTLPPRDALEQLFTSDRAAAELASSLDYRFAPDLDAAEDAA